MSKVGQSWWQIQLYFDIFSQYAEEGEEEKHAG